MNIELNDKNINSKSDRQTNKDIFITSRIFLTLALIILFSRFFVIVNAGERGVLMQFGEVQQVLSEGIHVILPVVNSVEKLSVRVQKQEQLAEASSKDLQDVFTDIALNWHIIPEKTNLVFQQIGNKSSIIDRIIDPAVEEVLKAVIAEYTAVETKQIAEQEAKKAGFIAIKAAKEAEAKVNLAKGEAEAQGLIQATLNNELLKKQTIEKWDGKLPLVMGSDNSKVLELELDDLIENN
ncbi:MAG TPA: prohibitin family protein [Coleofasciculaceae cyanobacterium]|jgi:ribosomal protein L22